MIILAPISIGELYDKITILQVKLEKFSDELKLRNVENELEKLRQVADIEVEKKLLFDQGKLADLVEELRKINEELWDIEDGKRAAEDRKIFDESFISLAREVYLKNDRRAALKRSINILTGSTIIEEKSHKKVDV